MTSKIYFSTAAEMARMDRLAVGAGLSVRQMMELAGFGILAVLEKLKFKRRGLIVIVVGKGNKGGDGLSAARHLLNNGYRVTIVLTTSRIKPDAAHLLKLLRYKAHFLETGKSRAVADGTGGALSNKKEAGGFFGAAKNLRILSFTTNKTLVFRALSQADLIIDALIGYRLSGPPREPAASLIKKINGLGKKVIAYDVPTGIDATTGECLKPCIKAWATLTLALPKKAFKNPAAKKMAGRLFLADLGIPAGIYRATAPGARRPDFARRGVIEL